MSTLVTLRANVLRNLGGAGNFYTSAEVNQYIGEGYKNAFTIMIQNGDGYFVQTVNLGFTANVATVDLSALNPAFYHVAQLERNLSSGGTIPLEKNERRYIPNLPLASGVGDSYQPTYKIRNLNLVLEPTPQTTEAASSTSGLKLDYVYVPDFPNATSVDGFTFDSTFPIVYEPLVELWATINALETKDGMGGVSDIASFRDRYAKLEQNFINSLDRSDYQERVQYMGNNYGPGYEYY